jgi:hypothetical protein
VSLRADRAALTGAPALANIRSSIISADRKRR